MSEIKFEELPEPVGKFILAQNDIKPMVTSAGWYWHYKDVIALLTRYLSYKHIGGPVWVKASDRLPVNPGMYCIKWCGKYYTADYYPVSKQFHITSYGSVATSTVEWLDESQAEQPVADNAKAFKWAVEYSNEKGEELVLYNSQWTLIAEDGDKTETEDLTPDQVAELYRLQCPDAEQLGREVNKNVLEFIRGVAENWDCDPDSHTYNLPCRKCEAAKLYKLLK